MPRNIETSDTENDDVEVQTGEDRHLQIFAKIMAYNI